MSSAVVPLGILDDHSVCWKIKLPCHAVRQYEDLDGILREELRYHIDFFRAASFVKIANAISQGLDEGFIFDVAFKKTSQIILIAVKESRGLVIGGCIRQQIDRRKFRLLSRRNVDNNRTSLKIMLILSSR